MYMVNTLSNKINSNLHCIYNIYQYDILSTCSILNRIKIIKEIKNTMRSSINNTNFCCILFCL